jgi:hypothetical protein
LSAINFIKNIEFRLLGVIMVMEIRSAKKEDIGNILKVIGSDRFGEKIGGRSCNHTIDFMTPPPV